MAAKVVNDLPTCLSSVPEIRLSKQWRRFLSRIYICSEFAVGGKLFFFAGKFFLLQDFFFVTCELKTHFQICMTLPPNSVYLYQHLSSFFFSLFKYTYRMVFHVIDSAKDQNIVLFCRNASLSILSRISNYKSVFLHSFFCE